MDGLGRITVKNNKGECDMKIYKELQLSIMYLSEQDVIRTSGEGVTDEGTTKDNYDWLDKVINGN